MSMTALVIHGLYVDAEQKLYDDGYRPHGSRIYTVMVIKQRWRHLSGVTRKWCPRKLPQGPALRQQPKCFLSYLIRIFANYG